MAPAAQRRTRRERSRTAPRSGAGGHEAPVGVGGHDLGMGVVHLAVARRHPLEQRRPGQLGPREQQPGVELGARLELDPGQLLARQEDREQAQPAVMLLDHLARRARAGEEPGAEVGQLGLQGRPAHEPGVAPRRTRPGAASRHRRRWPWHLPPASASSKSPSSSPPPRVRHALRATNPSTTARMTSSATHTTAATNRRAPHAASWARRMARDGAGWPKTRWSSADDDEREPQGDGDGEGDEQPPRQAGEATVEKARRQKAGRARRVGQTLEAVLPSGTQDRGEQRDVASGADA